MNYLLDTSVYSQVLKREPLNSVISHWKKIPDERIFISIICELEVLQGLEMKNSERLWGMYKSVLEHKFSIINLDILIAKIYAKLIAELKSKGRTVSQFNLLIASTAISKNLTLATCNYKDFKDISGLKVEDWSINQY